MSIINSSFNARWDPRSIIIFNLLNFHFHFLLLSSFNYKVSFYYKFMNHEAIMVRLKYFSVPIHNLNIVPVYHHVQYFFLFSCTVVIIPSSISSTMGYMTLTSIIMMITPSHLIHMSDSFLWLGIGKKYSLGNFIYYYLVNLWNI